MNLGKLFTELKRRNVFKVAVAYLVVGWLLVQIMAAITPMLDLPLWAGRVVLVFLAIGFPVSLLFAWAFEMTADGVKRTKEVSPTESHTHHTGKKINALIIGLLVVALGYFIWESRFDDGDGMMAEASIAVLPFSNLSAEGDEAFVAGLHDDLLTQLSKISGLKVISRTSVLEYKNTTKNMRQIGEELGVNTLLEGGLQKAGERIRLNVQLIDADTDEHIWAETYNRELTMDNIFEVQSEITATIADALRVAMSDDEVEAIAAVPTQNLDIYSAYLEVRNNAGIRDVAIITANIEKLDEIVAIDPNFALAYAELARLHMDNYWWNGNNGEDRDKALVAVQRALELEPSLVEAKVALAYYHYWGWLNYSAALEVIASAGESANNNYELVQVKAYILRRSGDFAAALKALERAYVLNPRANDIISSLAQTYTQVGEFEKAGRMYDRIDNSSTFNEFMLWNDIRTVLGDAEYFINYNVTGDTPWFISFIKSNALTKSGKYDEALALIGEQYTDGVTENDFGVPISFMKGNAIFHKSGRAEAEPYLLDAIRHIETKLLSEPRNRFFLNALLSAYSLIDNEEKAWQVFARYENVVIAENDSYRLSGLESTRAGLYVFFGHYDEAADTLHKYLQMPAAESLKAVTSGPTYDEFKNHPRYQELIDAYGLTPKGAEALYPIDHPKYRPQEVVE